MILILKANLKKFLGTKFERIPKTLLTWTIMLFVIRSMGLSLEVSPFVLWFATLVATVGGFMQTLCADDTVDSLRGQLLLPASSSLFHAAFSLSVAVYVILTKSGLLLVGYLALSGFNSTAVIGFFVCFVAGGAVAYLLTYRSEKKVVLYRYIESNRHNFAIYIMRYLLYNKSYLSNTAVLWAFGCAFAFFTGRSDFPNVLPLGFALMCLNTPLGILLSSDKALYKQIRLLPGQAVGVLVPYALFVAGVNVIGCSIYMTAWWLISSDFTPAMVAIAIVFALISGVLTIIIEMRFPLLDWKVQSDLWHHPRKYVVPGILILLSLPIAMLMGGM